MEKIKKIGLPMSEFFTSKYDDLDQQERIILSQMSSGDKIYFRVNDFRKISIFKNDGKKIGQILSNLLVKNYISKNPRGWKINVD